MQEVTTKPALKMITIVDVCAMTGMGKTYIYDQIEAGNFPKQVILGARSSRWLEHEVQAWIQKVVEAYRGEALSA